MLHKRVTLLIIDDNSIDRANYARMLRTYTDLTYQIIEAESAKAAVQLLNKGKVDCILLDYILPDTNGIELLKLIKDKFENHIPVIMLTGHGDENIAVTAMKEGAVDYLSKDKIEPELLNKTIVNAIKTSRLQNTIEEQKNRLDYFAYYDHLTGLINRHTFEELVHQATIYAKPHNEKLAIILLDLDNFVTINDTLGQLAGDEMLIETAKKLKEVLPEETIISRCGDDEFAVLLTGVDIDKLSEETAEVILNEIMKPTRISIDLVHIGASIGIACYPTDTQDSSKLLNHAYTALIHAKNEGRGIILHYSENKK